MIYQILAILSIGYISMVLALSLKVQNIIQAYTFAIAVMYLSFHFGV
jgi:hypothetical protein